MTEHLQKRKICIRPRLHSDDIRLESIENLIGAFLGVDVELNGLAQVKGKDSHDGLCVDHITAGYQVEVIVKTANIIDEGLNFID